MSTIVIASRNEHKIDEIRSLPSAAGLELVAISHFGEPPEVEENGLSFEENAVLKAVKYSLWLKRSFDLDHPVVAEDSGLQVDALMGWPGIHSARIAATSAEANAMVLERLAGSASRSARFVAVTALARNSSLIGTWQGVVRGNIAEEAQGAGGFGYDPIFHFPEYGRSFAELSMDEKNSVSHRTRAWNQVLSFISESIHV